MAISVFWLKCYFKHFQANKILIRNVYAMRMQQQSPQIQ